MTDQGIIKAMEGHVYVVAFESGVVKVGRSGAPQGRLRQYRKDGVVHGNPVVDTWVSPRHGNFSANEARLIQFCATHGTLASNGTRGEYFRGVTFELVRSYAESLKFQDFDHTKHARETAWVGEMVRKLWDPRRVINLPPAVTPADLPRVSPEDPRRSEVDGLLAEQLEVSLSELRGLPQELQGQLTEHVASFATLRQDEMILTDLLAQIQRAIDDHADQGFNALREKIWSHLDGSQSG